MKCLAIIPARGGSKGIPFKNIADLNGKPLIFYTIEAAKKSRIFNRIIVSTDNKKIVNVIKKYRTQVIRRPRRLAGDRISTESVMFHVLKRLKGKWGYQPDIIFLLQPTSPLRTEDDIKAAYKKFIRQKLDSLLSVTRNTVFIWKEQINGFKPINYNYCSRPRRQDTKGQFRENGAIYITKHCTFIKFKNRLGGKIGYYMMDEDRSVEIDRPFDLIVAEQILKERRPK